MIDDSESSKKRKVAYVHTETLHVVPDYVVIAEDIFDPNIDPDVFGPRHFSIIYDLVNAITMNLETCLESYFSSFKSQSFGPQHHETLVNRGIIKSHIRNDVHLFIKICVKLSILLKTGFLNLIYLNFVYPLLFTPILMHLLVKKIHVKFKISIYAQALADPAFLHD